MKIHFIGIGGIGVSALAQYYLQKGNEVSGSDLAPSEITDMLEKLGAKIFVGNKAEHVTADVDVVVYSPAVKKDNPEMLQASSFKLQMKSYPEALGELTKEHYTIAVSGSHGKSTTTAMLALVLVKAGIDPTVIVGTKLAEFGGTNFRMGKSKYLVIEACEYDGSFLEYSPQIAVITNMDKEHLDYFKTFANVVKAFKSFIMRLPEDGFLVFNHDDVKLRSIAKGKFSAAGYSLRQPEAKRLAKIMKVPGQHNVSNALAVLNVASILGVKDSIIFKALSEFKGTWRRFEVKEGQVSSFKFQVVSDYGHHPTEVAATLKAAREKFGKKKIWLIFQPHQHQRTFYLLKDFVALFKKVKIDEIIITDIYDVAGREEVQINVKIDSPTLVKKIGRKNVQHMLLQEAEDFVKKGIKKAEVLIIMGAGNIYRLFDKF